MMPVQEINFKERKVRNHERVDLRIDGGHVPFSLLVCKNYGVKECHQEGGRKVLE